jgi:L-2-hydroxyglutarate oxidase LhgO
MTERVDAVVAGAGVVGLAVARALARAGREVVVLEAEAAIGTQISSRNSEVIHAGIYYPQGSLKARLCVAGRRALHDFCGRHGIAHRRCGKLIVATSEDELPTLRRLQEAAAANGLAGKDEALVWLDGAAARDLEPELRCTAALLSPATGIVDSHGLMLAYQGEAEARGAAIAFLSRLVSAEPADGGFRLRVTGRGGESEIACGELVNAAGLGAQALARSIAGMPAKLVPPLHYVKGSYFSLAGRAPFARLVYPVPAGAGLGVHLTLDLAGQARFGPDAEYVPRIDYDVDPARGEAFYAAVRRYWPALRDGALQPAYAGIRPKLQGPQDPARDFVIQGPESHGLRGLVNLFGIESPGLTASLAIADEVARRLAP